MAVWHDIYTRPPADGALIWAHRSIFDTPPIYGTWDAADASLVCGLDGWRLNDYEIWTWKPFSGPLPDFPAPAPVSGWVDPWHNPPADAQPPWVRRFSPSPAALAASWSLPAKGFIVTGSPNVLP
jgi:hypothetical protein